MPELDEEAGLLTDAYACVFCALFELGPDETTTVPDLSKQVSQRHRSVAGAVERAADALLVVREPLRAPSGAVRWRRAELWPRVVRPGDPSPGTFTLERLVAGGALRSAALAVLDALVSERYLELSARGYEVRAL